MYVFSIILIVICGLVLLSLIFYALVARICYHVAFERKSVLKRAEKQATAEKLNEFKIDFGWWDKQEMEEFSIESGDKLKLFGHFIKKNNKKVVIVVHGYGANFKEMQQYVKLFVDKNYSVLAVENRAHGKSEGDMIGFGVLDKDDVLLWIKFINEKFESPEICLFGLSMGGATVCLLAGEKLPSNVRCIISDCGFASVYEQFKHVAKKYGHLPAFPSLYIFDHYMKTVKDFDLKKYNAINSVKNTKIPILYIHGKKDDFVPIENSVKMYDATPENLRDKFFVEEADHAMAYPTAEILYEKKVQEFLRKNM